MKNYVLLSLVLFSSLVVCAQQTVRGLLTQLGTNTPLPGISVTVKGTGNATATSADGRFSIVAANGDVLIFSGVGFQQKELVISGPTLNASLSVEDKSLDEVVVTGYTTRLRRNNVGAASTITVDDIRTQAVASFDQILQGQAAGVNVKAGSGQPGRNADVIIRGRSSVNGSVTPLYVVDGVEVRPGDFSTMNQGDFESVTVLKDAASTAIYGSRGGNGVIVVTTRKGRAGKVRFSYDGQYGQSRLPENKLKLMNTQEKLDFEMNMAGNPWGWSAAEVAELRKTDINWADFVFQKGKIQTHQLAASGGNEKTTFYTSLSTYKEEGITLNTGINRYTGRINVAHNESNFKIGANLSGGWSDFRGTFEGDQSIGSALNTIIWALPYEPVYQPDGSYTNSVQFPFWINPVEDLKENTNKSWQLKSTGSVFAEVNLPWVKNLTYRINAGGDYSQSEEFNIIKRGTQSAAQNEAFGQDFRRNGEVTRELDRRLRYTITNSLTYKTILGRGGDHNLSASVFTEYLKTEGRSFGFTGYGLLLPFQNERGLVTGTVDNEYIPVVDGNVPANSSLNSYFSTIDYAFKNRYLLSLTGRTDGSSRLSPANRWTKYGSVAAGWILSEASFFKKINAVNFLKLRASYGAVGNQNGIGEFPYLQQFASGTYGGQGTLVLSRFGNDLLTWETRRTANIGLEFELFKSRIKGGVEVYNSSTNGLYFESRTPATSGGGFLPFLTNSGQLQNRGVELNFSFRILNFKDFKWTIDANYAYNKNTIKSLPDGQDLLLYNGTQALQVGKPLNSFYLVRYNGVNPANGNSQYIKADGKTVTEIYDANDLSVLGTSDAPHNGGVTNTFSFKGLELSAFFVYNYGNYVFNNARFNVEYYAYTTSGFSRNALTAWQTPGQVTNFPRISEATEGSTTRFLEKGDFVRLRNVLLSYSLPKNLTTKLKLQGLRVFVQGQNLYTWHKFQGWDPEVSSIVDSNSSNASVSGAQYPVLKSVTVGLNLNF